MQVVMVALTLTLIVNGKIPCVAQWFTVVAHDSLLQLL
jgi:hypothetical protein